MRTCTHRCLHKLMVQDYRAERERQLSDADEAALGYDTELAELRPNLITFKRYLTGRKRS